MGNIDWYGSVVSGEVNNINYFLAGALSHAMPNGNQAGAFKGFIDQAYELANGLNPMDPNMTAAQQAAMTATEKAFEPQMLDGKDHYGWAVYVGGRYDLASRTKIGAEFNHGSADWIAFEPANDDMWTSKLGVRGNVYEAYLIQELHNTPIDKAGLAFVRVGYQYYDIKYTGSNSWLGAPVAMDNLTSTAMNAQFFTPIRTAQDIYVTFNIRF